MKKKQLHSNCHIVIILMYCSDLMQHKLCSPFKIISRAKETAGRIIIYFTSYQTVSPGSWPVKQTPTKHQGGNLMRFLGHISADGIISILMLALLIKTLAQLSVWHHRATLWLAPNKLSLPRTSSHTGRHFSIFIKTNKIR